MAFREREKGLEYMRQYSATLHSQRKAEGLCVHCGRLARIGTTQCQQCFEHRSKRLRRNRQMLKKKSVEYLGSKCVDCGLKTAFMSVYDFHHKDPTSKEANIAYLMDHVKAWKQIQPELDKCVLLCANCHRIRHELEDNGPP
jgi:hypothetical protein